MNKNKRKLQYAKNVENNQASKERDTTQWLIHFKKSIKIDKI